MALTSRWFTSLALLGGTWLVAHCSASDAMEGAGAGASGSYTDAALGDSSIESDGSNTTGGSSPQYDLRCGVVDCVPDDESACAMGGAPGAGGAGGAPGAQGGEGGVASGGVGGGEGGAGGADPEAAPPWGGAGGGDGDVGVGGADGFEPAAPASGGAGPQFDELPAPDDEQENAESLSCQVTLQGGAPKAACRAAGTAGVDKPCFDSGDCSPGLGCVLDGAARRCLPFCCGGDGACSRGRYCAERELSAGEETGHGVPVCVAADSCSLSDPYPCEGGACSCDEGKACMVVRADGTTTCATPGAGKAGDSCPCAWGYVCSQATESCVRLCETSRAMDYCGNQQCQASAELPAGWGVCLAPEDDAPAAR